MSGRADKAGRQRVASERHGDALASLFATEYVAAVRLAALLMGDASAADEITIGAFSAVFAGRGRVAAHSAESGQAVRRQVVLGARRYRQRYCRPSGRGAEAATAVACGQAFAAVMAGLGSLPDRQREAVILRCYAGLSADHIAAVAGVSTRLASRRLRRGLAALTDVGLNALGEQGTREPGTSEGSVVLRSGDGMPGQARGDHASSGTTDDRPRWIAREAWSAEVRKNSAEGPRAQLDLETANTTDHSKHPGSRRPRERGPERTARPKKQRI